MITEPEKFERPSLAKHDWEVLVEHEWQAAATSPYPGVSDEARAFIYSQIKALVFCRYKSASDGEVKVKEQTIHIYDLRGNDVLGEVKLCHNKDCKCCSHFPGSAREKCFWIPISSLAVLVAPKRKYWADNFPELVKEIQDAFEGVQPSPTSSLHSAELADDSMGRHISEAEYDAARAQDPETNWADIPLMKISKCNAATSFMSPRGWLFHLPAFLIWSLNFYFLEERDDEFGYLDDKCPQTIDYLINQFVPECGQDKDQSYRAYCIRWYGVLTEKQREAVRKYLLTVAEHSSAGNAGTAKEALDTFWSKSFVEQNKFLDEINGEHADYYHKLRDALEELRLICVKYGHAAPKRGDYKRALKRANEAEEG